MAGIPALPKVILAKNGVTRFRLANDDMHNASLFGNMTDTDQSPFMVTHVTTKLCCLDWFSATNILVAAAVCVYIIPQVNKSQNGILFIKE